MTTMPGISQITDIMDNAVTELNSIPLHANISVWYSFNDGCWKWGYNDLPTNMPQLS